MPLLRVIYRSSAYAGRELSLEGASLRVGRDPACDVTFDEVADRIVSRVHAEIRWEQVGPVIFPASGRVVLRAKQRLLGPTLLVPGDVLELAGPGGPAIEFQFERATGPKPKPELGTEDVDSGAVTLFVPASPPRMMPAPSDLPPSEARATPVPAGPAERPPPELTAVPGEGPLAPSPVPLAPPAPAAAGVAPVAQEGPAVPEPPSRSFATHRAAIVIAFVGVAAVSVLSWLQTPKEVHYPHAPKAIDPPPKTRAAAAGAPDPAIRKAFAALRRAELAQHTAQTAGTADGASSVTQAAAAYEAAVSARHAPPPDEALELIEHTARRLGECGAAMPVGFLAEVSAALSDFANQTERVQALNDSIERARTEAEIIRNIRPLTAEGLPPELVLIPLEESDFRTGDMTMPEAGAIAKGLWRLVPAEARRFGLDLGAHAEELTADLADERLQVDVEAKKVAKALVPVFNGPAAGSALLLMATYDHGHEALLRNAKKQAGLKPDESDPEQVSFWRLYESGALSDAVKKRAVDMFTLAAVTSAPSRFGLNFQALFHSP